jgi:hypothetical protein
VLWVKKVGEKIFCVKKGGDHLQSSPPLNLGGENPRGVRNEARISFVRIPNLKLVHHEQAKDNRNLNP